jgi:hypothetical protein
MKQARSRHNSWVFWARSAAAGCPPATTPLKTKGRQIAGFEVDKQRDLRRQRLQQGGLADSRLAEDHPLDATRLGQALIGGDDAKTSHRIAPRCEIAGKPLI